MSSPIRPLEELTMSADQKNDTPSTSQVVDFSEIRARKLDEKRRKTERIFFKNLMGVYTVSGNANMRPIEMLEVSEEGCSFQVVFDSKNPWPTKDEPIPLRFYFSNDTYIMMHVQIRNSRPCIDQGMRYIRYGCEVDQSFASYEAYLQFVRFMKAYSLHAHRDMGDVSVFYP